VTEDDLVVSPSLSAGGGDGGGGGFGAVSVAATNFCDGCVAGFVSTTAILHRRIQAWNATVE